mmetsp:Transcript_121072/g.220155  ORF Transcript_121072/g.220155 Transcript_121072/m.220155 type:complete len:363 (+) Transcript_121072:54-1142(+)
MAMAWTSDVVAPVQAEPSIAELRKEDEAHCEVESVHEEDDEPASPLGSALLRIRRARAFLGREKASALAEQLEAELCEPEKLATAQAVSTTSSDDTNCGGLTQEALDALCVEEDSSEEADVSDEDEIPVLRQPSAKAATGLDQAALDALCVDKSSSDSDAEEEEQLATAGNSRASAASSLQGSMPADALRVAGALAAEALRAGGPAAEAFAWCCCPSIAKAEDMIKIGPDKDEKKAGKYTGEALLLRVRRLRAFRGEAEAAEFSAKASQGITPADEAFAAAKASITADSDRTSVQKPGGQRSKPRPSQLESPMVSPEVSPRKDTSPSKERMESPVLKVATPQRKRLSSKNPSSPHSPPQPAS